MRRVNPPRRPPDRDQLLVQVLAVLDSLTLPELRLVLARIEALQDEKE